MWYMSKKLYTILTLPLAQEPPALWVIKFTFFSEPFLARHYFKPNLSASCSRVENIGRRNVAFSLHGLFGNIGPRLNTGPGKYQNYNFGRPSLGHLYYITVCLIHAWWREEDFSRNNAFSVYDLSWQAPVQEPLIRGHEIYNFGGPLFAYHYYKFIIIIHYR